MKKKRTYEQGVINGKFIAIQVFTTVITNTYGKELSDLIMKQVNAYLREEKIKTLA